MPMNDDPNARVWEENQQLKAKLDAEIGRADRAVRSVIDTTKELVAAEVKLANAIAAKEKAEAALLELRSQYLTTEEVSATKGARDVKVKCSDVRYVIDTIIEKHGVT